MELRTEHEGMVSQFGDLDRAVALQQENLGLDKLKLIMLMVLWNRHQDLDPLLIEELLTPLNSAQLH